MLEYIFYTDTKIFKLFQFTNFMEQNTIIFLSFIFIMTLGVSHGALDGKIIWEQGSNSVSYTHLTLPTICSV